MNSVKSRIARPAHLMMAVRLLLLLWALTGITANTQAQVPAAAVTAVQPNYQSSLPGPTYQAKADATISNIPPTATSVTATFTYQRLANGAWVNSGITPQSIFAPTAGGTANFGTSYTNYNPVKGEMWRVNVTGSYIIPGNPPFPVTAMNSLSWIPIP